MVASIGLNRLGSMVDQEYEKGSNENDLEKTLHHLLTAENSHLEDDDDDKPAMDSEFTGQKHLTLESILEDADGDIFFDLDEGKRSPVEDLQEGNVKRVKAEGKIIYEQLLSPASLSPQSMDGNQSSGNSGKLSNEFTMSQVAETKRRIINTHKLLLNFNFLKDGYARTCVEFKKVMHHLRDSEVHRAHLLQENQQLRDQLAALTAKMEAS